MRLNCLKKMYNSHISFRMTFHLDLGREKSLIMFKQHSATVVVRCDGELSNTLTEVL